MPDTQTPTLERRIADVVVIAIKTAIAPLKARITALEGKAAPIGDRADIDARLKALEERPTLAYRGVFASNVLYREGSLVSRQGGLWLAEHETRSQPGNGDSSWRLIVKSGNA